MSRQQTVLKTEWRLGRPTFLWVNQIPLGVRRPSIYLLINLIHSFLATCRRALIPSQCRPTRSCRRGPRRFVMLPRRQPSCNWCALNSCRSVRGLFSCGADRAGCDVVPHARSLGNESHSDTSSLAVASSASLESLLPVARTTIFGSVSHSLPRLTTQKYSADVLNQLSLS